MALIPILMLLEPLPIVVVGKVVEEGEELGREISSAHATKLPNDGSWGNPFVSYQSSVISHQLSAGLAEN